MRLAIAVILLVVQRVIDRVQLLQDLHHDFDGVLEFLHTDDCHFFISISAFRLLYL